MCSVAGGEGAKRTGGKTYWGGGKPYFGRAERTGIHSRNENGKRSNG